ncbi:site-specific integrase [Flaviaesturariibacter amylovorans]|uniref:Site-specific integrase n=1 Tax=Flaviaesturariibacter amylovorans TaxID=1084520 RepID=A0ABP8HIA5_9BACT
MQVYKPSVSFLLDTRKEKLDGTFPLKLVVYCRPEKKRYSTGLDFTKEEWEKLNGARLKDESLKEKKIKTQILVTKAESIIEKLEPFSFFAFEAAFFKQAVGKLDLTLKHWFDQYVSKLEQEGREGTRISYRTTLNSLLNYWSNLKLTDITKEFLVGYETAMKRQGKSPSTIGIYLRQLRAIINQAIEQGALKAEQYPFKSYDIPGARNVKKALSDEQLQKILSYAPASANEEKALDFWILSYLCNGMNMTDILHLKPENIDRTFLYYIRQKTIRTRKKDLRPIKVPLHPKAKMIIEKWRAKLNETPYLFPVLDADISPKTVKHRVQKFIKQVNEGMEQIRVKLEIDQKCTTYACRHSFSTRLMRKGASSQLIKESLGHSSVAVTENYLGDFADDVKLDFANMLTEFK